MQIVKILHVFIAVLSLTAILCPTSILVHVINENKQTATIINNKNQQYIDNTTITTTKTTTLFILEEQSTNHHRVQRSTHDPLSNPWLHSKQELLELLWKRGNELQKEDNDNDNLEEEDDHQTSLSTITDHQQHHYKHLTMSSAASSSTSLNNNKKQNKRMNNNNKSDQLLIGKSIDCCPSVLEMVEPHGGTNINGTYVELYQDGSVKQRFYELSCDRHVEGKPCLFMDRKLYNISKCVQKYSYSYALVRENVKSTSTGSGSTISSSTTNKQHHQHHNHRHNNNFNSGTGSGWMLDYIRVRSGCSCEVTPIIYNKKRRTNNNKHKKNKIKKHG